MKDSSNGSTKLIALLALLAVVAGAAYFLLREKPDTSGTTPPVSNEQAATTTPTPPTPAEPTAPTDAQKAVVVETKTLNLPAGAAPTIPSSTKSSDPAVEEMMGVRKLGQDSAPIKVVEYSSLTCGHCAAFHKEDFPKIKEQYIDTGKVQFIFKEFPLNKPALDASKVLRCMAPDKFAPFQFMLFQEQEKWAYQTDYLTPLKQNAKLAGLSEQTIESCLNNKELENRIVGDMKAGTDEYKIQSTPTFILNNGAKVIVGHQALSVFEENFKALLDDAAKTPATTPADTGTPTAPAAPATSEPAPVAPSPTASANQAAPEPTTPDAEAAAETNEQPKE